MLSNLIKSDVKLNCHVLLVNAIVTIFCYKVLFSPLFYLCHQVHLGFNVQFFFILYSDPDSGLASIHFALGETPRDVSHLDWVPLSPASFLTYIFEIPDGSYAWVKLRPVNNGKNNIIQLIIFFILIFNLKLILRFRD